MLVCQCKLYPSRDEAYEQGAAYHRFFARPGRSFNYGVRERGGQWELKVCYEHDEATSEAFERDGFKPCSAQDPWSTD